MGRLRILAAAAACALTAAGHAGATPAPLTVSEVSETATTLTVGWAPPAGAAGYVFTVDGARVSNTWDPARTTARFGKQPGQHSYGVAAVNTGADGTVTWPGGAQGPQLSFLRAYLEPGGYEQTPSDRLDFAWINFHSGRTPRHSLNGDPDARYLGDGDHVYMLQGVRFVAGSPGRWLNFHNVAGDPGWNGVSGIATDKNAGIGPDSAGPLEFVLEYERAQDTADRSPRSGGAHYALPDQLYDGQWHYLAIEVRLGQNEDGTFRVSDWQTGQSYVDLDHVNTLMPGSRLDQLWNGTYIAGGTQTEAIVDETPTLVSTVSYADALQDQPVKVNDWHSQGPQPQSHVAYPAGTITFPAGPGATGDLAVTVTAETATTLTVGWPAVPAAVGYVFTVDGKRVANTWDPARATVRFAKIPGAAHRYEVTAVTAGPAGTVTWPSASCSSTLQPGGNLAGFVAGLPAGATGCLAAGTYTGSVTLTSSRGTAAQPVTVTSANPAAPALIVGRLVTETGADNLAFTHLRFTWDAKAAGSVAPSVTVGSTDVVFDYDDVTNGHTSICFDLIGQSAYGHAVNTEIAHSRIHDCGLLPAQNGDHGIYVSGDHASIHDNWIYNNADRGVQLRGSQDAAVFANVIDGNGEGVIFGDLNASGNDVYNNIVANSRVRWNVESSWGSGPVGTGNRFHDNCVWASNTASYYNSSGGLDLGAGYTPSGDRVGDPGYPRGGDYRLPAGSPCAGYGTTVTPGP